MWVAIATIPLCLVLAGPPAVAQSPTAGEPALAGTFSPAGSLATGRYGHFAPLVPDGRVLVLPGLGVETPAAETAEVWDPATASFSVTGPMVRPTWRYAATTLADGRVLIVGGVSAETSAEVWDPATGTFSATGAPVVPRGGSTLTLLPG
jgi:hypothetical protein